MTTVDIPRRHLVEETPEGTRWFYPVPVEVSNSYGLPETIGWEDEDGTALTRLLVGGRWKERPWLVSDRPLAAVVQVTQGREELTGYRLKALEDMDPLTQQVITAALDGFPYPGMYPERVTVEEDRERCGDPALCVTVGGEAEESCVFHQIRRRAYVQEMRRPEPVRTRIELPDSVPLSGGMDPAPGREWIVQDAVAAYYGGSVAHTLPGFLRTEPKVLGARLETALADLGLTGWTVHAFDHSGGGSYSGQVSCSGPINWDRPLEGLHRAKGRSRKAEEFNRAQARKAKVAMTFRAEVQMPRGIAAPTKAEALAKEATLLRQWLEALLPNHTTACSACRGVGFTD